MTEPRWKSGLPALALVPLVYLLSGLFVVETGDVAVIFRFGEVSRTTGSGLGFRLPAPIERHERVRVSEVRRVEPGRTRMLTGDTNLIDLDLVVQLTVADPVAWLTGASDPEAHTAAIVTAIATDVVATMDVDRLLTTGRAELQHRVLTDAQDVLQRMGTGARIDAVDIRELTPPPAVVDAFNDVSSARGDRETLALGAEAYTSRLLPETRGTSAARLSAAHATAAERVARAQADISRFEAARSSPEPRAELARRHSEALAAAAGRARVQLLPRGTTFVWDTSGGNSSAPDASSLRSSTPSPSRRSAGADR